MAAAEPRAALGRAAGSRCRPCAGPCGCASHAGSALQGAARSRARPARPGLPSPPASRPHGSAVGVSAAGASRSPGKVRVRARLGSARGVPVAPGRGEADGGAPGGGGGGTSWAAPRPPPRFPGDPFFPYYLFVLFSVLFLFAVIPPSERPGSVCPRSRRHRALRGRTRRRPSAGPRGAPAAPRSVRCGSARGAGAGPRRAGAAGQRSSRRAPFSRGALSALPLFPSPRYAAIPISLFSAPREPGAASRPPFPPGPFGSAAAAARRTVIPRRAARGAVRQCPATPLPRGRLLGLENGGRRRRAARRALGTAPCTSCNGGAESDVLLGSAAAAGSGTSSLLALGACRSPALSAAAFKATRGKKGFLGSGGKRPSFRL